MSLVLFFLANSGKKPLLGTMLGPEVGMKCWRLPGGAVWGGGQQHLSVWTPPIMAVPPSLSLPSLPGPGQALPPHQLMPRLGAADNNEGRWPFISLHPSGRSVPRPRPGPSLPWAVPRGDRLGFRPSSGHTLTLGWWQDGRGLCRARGVFLHALTGPVGLKAFAQGC